jgi:hypothetical protein
MPGRALPWAWALCLALALAAGHPLLPWECRVGLHSTDCESVGSCACYAACERLHALSGLQPYCHDTQGNVSTFTQLLRRVRGNGRVSPTPLPAHPPDAPTAARRACATASRARCFSVATT